MSQQGEIELSGFRMRVHIAALGRNSELVVTPVIKSKADRVWLLVGNGHYGNHIEQIEQISKTLGKRKISVDCQYHNTNDVPETIKSVKDIVEREQGNDIYLNLSSGSPLQSVALYNTAAMYEHGKNIHTYWCDGFVDSKKPKKFNSSDYGIEEVDTIRIQIPEKHLRDALVIINEKAKISKKELGILLSRRGIITPNPGRGNETQVTLTNLNQNIIIPLERKWGLIQTEKVGRKSMVSPTKEGKMSAVIFADTIAARPTNIHEGGSFVEESEN